MAGRSGDPTRAPDLEVDDPSRVFYSNCWWWAIRAVFSRGGYLIITRSGYGWWPHVMWSPDMVTLHQFEPTEKKRKRLLPPFIYRGYVKTAPVGVERLAQLRRLRGESSQPIEIEDEAAAPGAARPATASPE